MEKYLKILQQYEDKVSEANGNFEKIIDSSESFRRRSRRKNLTKAALNLLKFSNNEIVGKVQKEIFNSHNWWENFFLLNYPNEICIEYLKCSRKTYFHLTKSLRAHLHQQNGTSVEKKIALTLHKIGRSADFAAISSMFGIEASEVRKIFHKVIASINKYVLHKLVKMPGRDEAEKIANRFEDLSKIPRLIGALDSTHIPICDNGNSEFTNSQDYPSFVLQTVVDADCCFRDVSVRHPGSTDDHRVLEDSSIYKFHERVIPSELREINGHEVRYKIAASHTYPLLPWLLTEFEPAENDAECMLNYRLKLVRNFSVTAIARLKARFTILSRQIELSYKIAPQIIAACCAIHNICEKNQDFLPDEWLQESIQHEHKFPQPEKIPDIRTPNSDDIRSREFLKEYLREITIDEKR